MVRGPPGVLEEGRSKQAGGRARWNVFRNPPDLAQTFTGEDPTESVGKGRGPSEADWTKP